MALARGHRPEDIQVLEQDGAVVGYVELLRSEEVAHLDILK